MGCESAARISGEADYAMRDKEVLTVAEAAVLTGYSVRTITRLFERVPGVIILERPERMHKRRYRSIRIPRPVFEIVIRRITVR